MIILVIIVVFLVVVVGAIFSFQFLLSFIKLYLNDKKGRRNLHIGFLVLVTVTISFTLIIRIITSEPSFFSQGIAQLRQNGYVRSHVGNFASYSFYPDSLPKNPKDTAVFSVALIGDSLTLHFNCTMKRIKNADNWNLVKINTNSLTKTPGQ